ncbi:MAG: galactose mutarotase [Clostridia bacterium]|nr:galactose mutarotase [Clostridia bacterium]
MKCSIFGNIDGKQVKLYTITAGDITAEILTYGGVVRSLIVPDKNGKPTDVCLGYDTVEEYMNNEGYIGALIGRVGNRIGEGKFMLNGKEYNVGLNDNGNSLHGGVKGWNTKIWDDEVVNDTTLKLSIVSPDGEEGFPGTVKVEVVYTVIKDRGLKIDYKAVSDKDTVINMTNHAYFNLNGQGNGDILGNTLMIDADAIVPVDEKLIPHGEIMEVENTCFDFRTEKAIGKDIETDDIVMKYCGGYDVNFCLNGDGYRKVTVAKGNLSGIVMSVYTLEKGIQLYSGNFLKGVKGKGGAVYNKRNGFCLETQNYPNAINCPEYPSMVLKAGEEYLTTTEYVFEK